jgi:hypothetical protein
VREEAWLVRRDPFDERLIGEDPVPVVIAEEDVGLAAAHDPALAAVAAAPFEAAWPHTLQ